MDTTWSFPRPHDDADDLVAAGADLQPATLVAAYASGYFPMPLDPPSGDRPRRRGGRGPRIGWFSPRERGVLRPDALAVSGSLLRSTRRFRLSVDAEFASVMARCGDPSRQGRWITDDIVDAYVDLHRLGFAHSVEVWDADGDLVGGVYGVSLGALFAGESMFHTATDASKVSLVGLVAVLTAERPEVDPDATSPLIDTQWQTDHLASLGIEEWSRDRYLAHLPTLTNADPPNFARWAADPDGFTDLARAKAGALRRVRR